MLQQVVTVIVYLVSLEVARTHAHVCRTLGDLHPCVVSKVRVVDEVVCIISWWKTSRTFLFAYEEDDYTCVLNSSVVHSVSACMRWYGHMRLGRMCR